MREIRTSGSMRGGRKRAFRVARLSPTLLALAVNEPCSLRCRCGLGAPTAWAALEDVPVMQQTVQHGADRGDIAEQLAPVFHRTIRRQQRQGNHLLFLFFAQDIAHVDGM